jgi:hypothetical protein
LRFRGGSCWRDCCNHPRCCFQLSPSLHFLHLFLFFRLLLFSFLGRVFYFVRSSPLLIYIYPIFLSLALALLPSLSLTITKEIELETTAPSATAGTCQRQRLIGRDKVSRKNPFHHFRLSLSLAIGCCCCPFWNRNKTKNRNKIKWKSVILLEKYFVPQFLR